MRQLECFRELDRKKYIIWTDTGSHFRCAEFMHFLFKELAQLDIQVSFNLFCEKHGKNSRDQHFSNASYFIQQETMVKKLTSSQDICDAIEKHQILANLNTGRLNSLHKDNSLRIKKKPINTRAFVIPVHSTAKIARWGLQINDLKKYYNFFTDSLFVLKTHFMSDQLYFETIKNPDLKELKEPIKINAKVDKILPIIVDNNYLNKKMFYWKLMQRINTNVLNNSEILSDQDMGTNTDEYVFCKHVKCSSCKQICKYRLSHLNDNNTMLSQLQVNAELKNHGHPQSRKDTRTKKNRSMEEAKSELRNHYKNYHQ